MSERERRKQELLEELSKRFRESASNLKIVASRIQEAARVHEVSRRRLESAGADLHQCVDGKTGPLPFSYLEFMEFSDSDEFKKFRDMDVISEEEVKGTDLDELCRKLLEDEQE